MKVSVAGKVYEYDRNTLLNSEAIRVKRQTSMTVAEWQQGLTDDDPEAIKALVFMLMSRAGENPDWHELDFDHAQLEWVTEDDAADVDVPKDEDASGT